MHRQEITRHARWVHQLPGYLRKMWLYWVKTARLEVWPYTWRKVESGIYRYTSTHTYVWYSPTQSNLLSCRMCARWILFALSPSPIRTQDTRKPIWRKPNRSRIFSTLVTLFLHVTFSNIFYVIEHESLSFWIEIRTCT